VVIWNLFQRGFVCGYASANRPIYRKGRTVVSSDVLMRFINPTVKKNKKGKRKKVKLKEAASSGYCGSGKSRFLGIPST
jgi:hypothetical protein